jgi:hypothetical protein
MNVFLFVMKVRRSQINILFLAARKYLLHGGVQGGVQRSRFLDLLHGSTEGTEIKKKAHGKKMHLRCTLHALHGEFTPIRPPLSHSQHQQSAPVSTGITVVLAVLTLY